MNHGHRPRPRESRGSMRPLMQEQPPPKLREINPELGLVKMILESGGANHLDARVLSRIKDALKRRQPIRKVAQGLLNQRPLDRLELLQQA